MSGQREGPYAVRPIRRIEPLAALVGEGHDPEWRHVPVRRMALFLEQSLTAGLQWAVPEPNGEALWSRVRHTVEAFLLGLFRDGAFQGATPDQAFFVRCDATVMTQDDIDSGRLIVEIGIATVCPAEFVIVRVGQWVRRPPD